ncbi:MAG: hypothetical protein HKN13_07175 [Rhodothermales bacterium]|nr:hypothetical protein [Rhodothermales bacterium]
MSDSKQKSRAQKRNKTSRDSKGTPSAQLPLEFDYPNHAVPGSISGEAEFARHALNALPELSDEQLAILKKRIADGYYRDAKVVGELSERIAKMLYDKPS